MRDTLAVPKRSWWNPYPGVNARIIIPFLAVIIAIAAIGTFTVTSLVAGSLQERFTNQLKDSADSASNTIVDIERQEISTIRKMAFTNGMADAIASRSVEDLTDIVRPIATADEIDEVLVFDTAAQPLLYLQRDTASRETIYDS